MKLVQSYEKVLQCAAETAQSGGAGVARGLDTVNQPFKQSITFFPLKDTVLCKFTLQLFHYKKLQHLFT